MNILIFFILAFTGISFWISLFLFIGYSRSNYDAMTAIEEDIFQIKEDFKNLLLEKKELSKKKKKKNETK